MTFTFVSGNLALDLTGTVGRRRSEPVELLPDAERLGSWLAAADLAFPDTVVTADDLAVVLRLREATYALAFAATSGRPYDAKARAIVNELAATAPPVPSIGKDGSLGRRGGTPAAISVLARSAVDLLTGDSARHIRECASETCTRLYIDGSARGSRRWCDMRRCGNRAKAASFRTRHPAPRTTAES